MKSKEIKLLERLEKKGLEGTSIKDLLILNVLVNQPNHRFHQGIVFAVQQLKHPSSVPYLRQALENGFEMYKYTCSEDTAITKWFSHALYRIGTDEAIQVIKDFTVSDNAMIADEMKYRLSKIK